MKAIRKILTLSLFIFTLSLFNCKLSATAFSESGNKPWGCDMDLVQVKRDKTQNDNLKLTPGQKSCRAMIRFFQVYISPIDGPRSSFYPTSSQYTLEAIQKYGVLRGIGMGCDRLLRENGETWVYDLTDNYGMTRKLDPIR